MLLILIGRVADSEAATLKLGRGGEWRRRSMKATANFTIFFCTWGFEFATRFEFVTHRQRDDQRRNDTTRTGCDLTVPKHTVRKTGTELKQEPDGTEVDSASPNSLHLLVGPGRQSPTAVGFPYLI